MADKNIQMKGKNGSSWDNLYPLTKGLNVTANDGKTFEQHETDTNIHITAAERTTWNSKQDTLGYIPVNKSGDTMTGALTLKGDPTAALHPATKQYVDALKQYVDSLVQGIDNKASVKVATTTNITLSGTQTIDGVTLSVNDRVLVKDQATSSQNGLYTVQSSTWVRTTDSDTNTKLTPGSFVFVEQGTINADTGWVVATDGSITIGTTAINFVQFSAAGQVTVGTGLTKNGLQIYISNTGVSSGTYTKVTVNAQGQVTSATTLSAADIPNLDWSKVTTGKPTTLVGYGITDAASSSHVGATGTAHGVATTSTAGFMSAADKTKLDSLSSGSNSIVVSSTDPTTSNADFWYAVV